MCLIFFFFRQKTAYEMRISDWSSDVCSSDLQESEARRLCRGRGGGGAARRVPVPRRRLWHPRARRTRGAARQVARHGRPRCREFRGPQQRQFAACARDKSEAHTSELQSLMRTSSADFSLKQQNIVTTRT